MRHRKGFLDRSIAYGFSRVLVFDPERFQSHQELVSM